MIFSTSLDDNDDDNGHLNLVTVCFNPLLYTKCHENTPLPIYKSCVQLLLEKNEEDLPL